MLKMKMAVLLVMLGVSSVGVFAQRGGGMGRGGGMRGNSEMMEKMRDQMEALRAFPVAEMWSALSLGMDVPDDTRKMLRVVMMDAWKKRHEWLLHAQEHGTWKEVEDELKDLRKTVEGQVKAMLNKDQQKELKELLKQSERMSRSGRR